jgi:hypothetical protein
MTTNTTASQYLSAAYRRGRFAAEARATNTEIPGPPITAEALIALIEEESPAAEAFLPSRPDLSAEWGGSETPRTLVRTITGHDPVHPDEEDAICEAWERGVSDHFYQACITELRRRIERRA